MSSACSCRRILPLGLLALTFCLCGSLREAHAQDTDTSAKPDTTTPAAATPGSVVMPPTSTRPTTPLAMPAPAPKPHPIFLPPPPDDPTPALKAVAKKPTAAEKKAATKAAAAATQPAPVATTPVVATPAPAAAKPAVVKPTPTAVTKPAPAAAVVATPAPAATKPATVIVVPAATPAPSPAQAIAPAQEAAPAGPVAVPQADTDALNKGANTFGFYAGETRDQIITAIGKDNVLKQSGDILEVAASPKPDPNFETFLLIVGPQQGLVKIIATGKDIDGDPAGRAMKEQFTALKTTLGTGYGQPSDNFDFLDVKAKHRGANQFMLSLTDTERTLAVYWTKKDFGNSITSISLNGNGLGNEKGYLSLEYEFSGYHAYLLAKK